MKGNSRQLIGSIAGVAAAAAMLVPSAAFAASGPSAGRGGGGGGGETTVANNLSVPTVFVGSVGFGLATPSAKDSWTAPVMPTGAPSKGWEIDPTAYYYVQGTNTWQAQYMLSDSASVNGKWGDNLAGGTASLRVGNPVRVEMGLTSTTATASGFTVVKLQPSQLDRLSAYGTLAQADTSSSTGYSGILTGAMPARVWVAGATLSIDGGSAIALPGEVNATGAVVFGYNWRPTAAGGHTLTFSVPSSVTIANSNTGSPQSISITVNVGTGGGKR